MALVQPAAAVCCLLGIALFLLGVRNWWTLVLLVAGIAGLLIGR